MKRLAVLVTSLILLGGSAAAAAQTPVVIIKAFTKPQTTNMEVKIVAPINCNGTTTDLLRIWVPHQNTGLFTNEGSLFTNLHFISISELIGAAKNGYAVELAGPFAFNNGRCDVQNFTIYVQ